MSRYDFLGTMKVILSNIWIDFNLTQFHFGQLFTWTGTNNDHIWLPIGYTNDSEQCSNRLHLTQFQFLSIFYMNWHIQWSHMTSYRLQRFGAMFEPIATWPNFAFDQLLTWIGTNNYHMWIIKLNGTNNDHIRVPKFRESDSEHCSKHLKKN